MADGEKRIKELEEITALTSNDYFVVDSSASGGETKKYKATNITDIIDNIPELVAEFEPNHYYDRDALVAHEGKVYYHNAPGASYEEFPTGYQFIQIDLTGLLSRLGFGISIQHNSSFTYNKGDYCMEDYILYRCLNDNVTGAWSSSDWERASLGYDLSSIYKPRLDEHDEQIEEALALGTANGSIATFTDGSTLPMKKLEVDIEPVQDLHGYENPWVGGSKKNLFQKTDYQGIYNASVGDNLATGTANASYTMQNDGANFNITTAWQCRLFVTSPLNSGNYVVSMNSNSGSIRATLYITDGDLKVVQNIRNYQAQGYYQPNVLTIENGQRIAFYASANATGSILMSFQAESGTTATTYERFENICPISGWSEVNVSVCGKNLFDESILLECSGWTVSDGVYSGESAYVNAKYGNGVPNLAFKPNTQYTFSLTYGQDGSAGIGLAVAIRYTDDTVTQKYYTLDTIGFVSVTSTAGKSIKRLELSYGANRTIHLSNMQLEEGTTPSTYEPYNGSTYTIDLDGTRYGGKLDVVSGVLTVDRAYVDMGSQTWSYTNGRFYYNPTNAKVYTQIEIANLLCSQYPSSQYSSQADNSISSYAGYIYVRADSYSGDATAFKTAMNGVQLVYELATPQTIQLTPTEVKSLLATNNIFADTGQVNDATYVRNANITINDLIRRIEALES